jgi:hypothetical protein
MMDVGGISQSHWQTESEGQPSGGRLRRTLHRAEPSQEHPFIGAPSECELVSPISHCTAQIGLTISRIQDAIHWIDQTVHYLEKVLEHRPEQAVEGGATPGQAPAQVKEHVTLSLERIIASLCSCRTEMDPSFQMDSNGDMPEAENPGSLQETLASWQALSATAQLYTDPKLSQDRCLLEAHREEAGRWLQHCAAMAVDSLEREERALGIDLSFVDKVNGCQLLTELSAWLAEVKPLMGRAHLPVRPARAAVLLRDPRP